MGAPMLGQKHVDRYRETDGHDWQGTAVLLLTTVVDSNGGGVRPRG